MAIVATRATIAAGKRFQRGAAKISVSRISFQFVLMLVRVVKMCAHFTTSVAVSMRLVRGVVTGLVTGPWPAYSVSSMICIGA
jgi:hypothetical protein